MKTIRALRGTTVALLVVAGALPAVQAQSIPSVEACIRYAEADAAYEAAVQPARAALEATGSPAAIAAFRAAYQQAGAAYEVATLPAKQALVAAYSAIYYDIDGGPRSDVQDVMEKLLEHHRQRCRELHGL